MKKIAKNFNKIFLIILCFISLVLHTACDVKFFSDDAEVINGLSEKGVITACVEVVTNISEDSYSQGSGAIFYKKTNYLINDVVKDYTYYAITNNHVIYGGYHFNPYKVYDCYGEVYNANLTSFDATYDLAVVTFNSKKEYNVLAFATADALVSDKVIAMGNPLGVRNSATLGEVLDFSTVDVENASVDECNVEFLVIKHSAPINTGSSGGVILNYNYQICGVNFACVLGEDKKFTSAYAIPLSKVKEFLTNSGFVL